ncbi:MAG: restriction endonuclease [Dermatophilaceae bacterium]
MANRGSARTEYEREIRAMQREADQQRKAEERRLKEAEKEARRLYVERRSAEIDGKNSALAQRVSDLETVLRSGLRRSATIDPPATHVKPAVPPLDLGPLGSPVAEPQWEECAPRKPGAISKIFGGESKYERKLAAARAHHAAAVDEASRRESSRQQQVGAMRRAHAERVAAAEEKAREHNANVDNYVRELASGQRAAVERYLADVLARVPLPDGFPQVAKITFNAKSGQVIAQIELPSRDVVPTVGVYRYLTTKDEERETARPKVEIAALYRSVISQLALLCIRDLLNSSAAVKSVALNGHVDALDPATGEHEYPCIISVNVDRESFPTDDKLTKVQPEACVQRHLKAIVSNHPYELEPIEPILDFDLSRFAFVDGLDAVSMLDSRPDLMDMSATNFEHLVRQLFEAQGAEGWTTQPSKDDGVDAVIVQRSSLMGGLSIVQAKRYSRVVGVAHLRELAGAMEEKKAGWGILITTSWFASGCEEKRRQHGRMELINGDQLVYLIKQHLKKDVLIGIPDRPRRSTA